MTIVVIRTQLAHKNLSSAVCLLSMLFILHGAVMIRTYHAHKTLYIAVILLQYVYLILITMSPCYSPPVIDTAPCHNQPIPTELIVGAHLLLPIPLHATINRTCRSCYRSAYCAVYTAPVFTSIGPVALTIGAPTCCCESPSRHKRHNLLRLLEEHLVL